MLDAIVTPLLNWYEKHKRILPWRASKNPYYIWISEIMLQQTRVEAVKPYFERFISALPTVEDVAKAPEKELLKLWEGLGYYNRVRNIQKAAITVVQEYAGQLPKDYDKLMSLSGIGSYTAGAIASIAYGIPAPAVDGNVLRVISRIDARYDDIMKQSTKKKVEEDLLAVMPKEKAGEFNQALMELGAIVCVPNGAPDCKHCPVKDLCKARKEGFIDQLPVKAKKKARKIEERTVLVIQDGDHVALHRRANKGLLAGLYEFPNVEGYLTEGEALQYVEGKDMVPLHIQELEESKHIFSHIEWRMRGYVIRVAALEEKNKQDLLFADKKEAEKTYAIPAAFSAYTKYMNIQLGQDKYRRKERK